MGNRDNIRSAGCTLVLIVYIATAIAAICLLCGCTREIYIPMESRSGHADTLREYSIHVDSVYLRDSILIHERGDTVFMTYYRDRYRYVGRNDTVYRSIMDTVRIEVPCPVEKRLTRWQQFKMDFGGISAGVSVAVMIAAVFFLIRRFKKKKAKV